MDWLTFISEVISALAWPAAVILITWWLRSHIGRLIPFTKKLKYGELEIEFDQQLSELKREIQEQRQIHPISKRAEDIARIEYLSSTADVSPRAALVDAWVGLELTAMSSARMLGLIPEDRTLPFPKVVNALAEAEVIGSKDVEILNRLRALRNQALHSPSFHISRDEAKEFIELTRDQADLIASESFNKKGGCGH